MKNKTFLLSAFAVALSAILFTSAMSAMTFYSFTISMPENVVAKPGDTITVNGGITVTGMYWLHSFDLKAEGLSYNYSINPQKWQEVPILRAWNPQAGVYREPNNFTITIKVPEDAYGVSIVTVTGQEHQSFRQVSNSTFFVLKVEGAQPTVTDKLINVTDILVPETIQEGEKFNITFRATNEGANKTAVAISILAPEDWTIEQKTQYLSINPKDSVIGTFTLTPSASAGTVSLYLEYPYRQEIINFTRVGPYLQPVTTNVSTTTTTTAEQPGIFGVFEGITGSITEVWNSARESISPVTMGIIAVLVIIIAWLGIGIVKDYRSSAKKPEETKKAANNTKAVNGIKANNGMKKQANGADVFNGTGIDKL